MTTLEFNKLTVEIFTSRLKQGKLATKHYYIDNSVKKTDIGEKLTNIIEKLLQIKRDI